MRVSVARPPNWDQVIAAFPWVATSHGVYFCWGNTIFNPHGIKITAPLVAHEKIHSQRQGEAVEGWWRRYIAEPAFRLAEELPAHRKEYFVFCRSHGNSNQRASYLREVAERLSGPLYGGIVGYDAARRAIMGG